MEPDILSAIYSDILSGIFPEILATFYLASILTWFLAHIQTFLVAPLSDISSKILPGRGPEGTAMVRGYSSCSGSTKTSRITSFKLSSKPR